MRGTGRQDAAEIFRPGEQRPEACFKGNEIVRRRVRALPVKRSGNGAEDVRGLVISAGGAHFGERALA